MKRGSALIMALMIIAVLSVMVLSFATEARLQAGVDVFVRERNRVNRLVEGGRILAEVVLSGFSGATEWSEDEDMKDLLEDDRWVVEKRALKFDSRCTIGPILLDEEHPESGVVTVEIEVAGSEGLNVNELYDDNARLRWQMMLVSHGVPEDYEVEAYDANHSGKSKFKLVDLLYASWRDWRDGDGSDDTAYSVDGEECGAELKWYEEEYEDEADDDEREYMTKPRNGAIPDVRELAYVRGFRDFPTPGTSAILNGGVINPEEDSKDSQITVRGILPMLTTSGSAKVNVNSALAQKDREKMVDLLLTVPGIFDEDDEDDMEQGRINAEAVVGALSEKPEDYDVDESRTWWPYKDFSDLTARVEDYDSNAEIGQEASEYLEFLPGDDSEFKLRIVCESMGVRRIVRAVGYLKDKKVRYTEWEEDPNEDTREESK